jgi:hypothetical protein
VKGFRWVSAERTLQNQTDFVTEQIHRAAAAGKPASAQTNPNREQEPYGSEK